MKIITEIFSTDISTVLLACRLCYRWADGYADHAYTTNMHAMHHSVDDGENHHSCIVVPHTANVTEPWQCPPKLSINF